MKKALFKDCFKQIKKTYKRFISLLLMALLGVGFFAGIRASSPDMRKTLDKYFDEQNVYDIQIVSTLGLTDDDISVLKNIDGLENIYGSYSEDVLVSFENIQSVIKILELDDNTNLPKVLEGRIPENSKECLIDYDLSVQKEIKIGDIIEIEEELEEDETSSFKESKLEVVGFAKSPLYISKDKGTSSLGSGKISYILYTHKDNIKSDFYTEIYATVNNAKEMETISENYDELIENTKNKIEYIKEERQNLRYEELISEANKKLDDAQKELDKEKSDAEKKIKDAEKEILDGKKEILEGKQKIKDAEKQLQEGKDKADVEFKTAEATISAGETALAENQIKINDARIEFEAKKKEAEKGISQINSGIETINGQLLNLEENKNLVQSVLLAIEKIKTTLENIEIQINIYEEKIKEDSSLENSLREEINRLKETKIIYENELQTFLNYGITEENLIQINAGITECNSQKQALEKQKEDIKNQLNSGEAELANAQNQIAEGRIQIDVSKSKLAEEKNRVAAEFVKAEKEIADGKKEISDAEVKLKDGEEELKEKKQEFETEIAKAEAKMIDAREKVNDIEKAKWYILDRKANTGFYNYIQDCENVERLGDVFPIVFFLIAVLISLTTMTRMVEEERIQIGTLKALGYTNTQIISKYIIYSILATFLGSALGITIGLNLLPNIFISMYKIIYTIEGMVIEFNLKYSLIGFGIMIICIVGATIYTALKELKNTPAELMRPKTPKPGKRVFLEKIPFIWKHLSFTQKVTIRNMFRYKKKFFMTIIGICGCTALIVTGFGLKDSISKIMDYQYKDIYQYDMMIALKGTLTEEEINNLRNKINKEEKIKENHTIYMTSEKAIKDDKTQDVQIVIPTEKEKINEIVKLKDLKTGKLLELNDENVYITDKLSELLNVKIGDEIILQDSDKKECKIKIGGIVEHYISHYIYMTDTLYEKTFEKEILPNVLYAKYDKEYSQKEEYEISEKLLEDSKIAYITLSSNLRATMNDTLSAMNIVVYILIICAGILAFVVLYNLANINISERVRELATIKVLGFYDKEVYDYVSREIILLTIIGILIGLIGGYFLNSFVLGTCEIPMLRFKKTILPTSYIYSILITIIFTIIVNFSTYFTLKKIDMIESLKSIE